MQANINVKFSDDQGNSVKERLSLDFEDELSINEMECQIEDKITEWFYDISYQLFLSIYHGRDSDDGFDSAYGDYLKRTKLDSDYMLFN